MLQQGRFKFKAKARLSGLTSTDFNARVRDFARSVLIENLLAISAGY